MKDGNAGTSSNTLTSLHKLEEGMKEENLCLSTLPKMASEKKNIPIIFSSDELFSVMNYKI